MGTVHKRKKRKPALLRYTLMVDLAKASSCAEEERCERTSYLLQAFRRRDKERGKASRTVRGEMSGWAFSSSASRSSSSYSSTEAKAGAVSDSDRSRVKAGEGGAAVPGMKSSSESGGHEALRSLICKTTNTISVS